MMKEINYRKRNSNWWKNNKNTKTTSKSLEDRELHFCYYYHQVSENNHKKRESKKPLPLIYM